LDWFAAIRGYPNAASPTARKGQCICAAVIFAQQLNALFAGWTIFCIEFAQAILPRGHDSRRLVGRGVAKIKLKFVE